eukprot:1139722-Pelagomonas_calceolata.AAC.2
MSSVCCQLTLPLDLQQQTSRRTKFRGKRGVKTSVVRPGKQCMNDSNDGMKGMHFLMQGQDVENYMMHPPWVTMSTPARSPSSHSPCRAHTHTQRNTGVSR